MYSRKLFKDLLDAMRHGGKAVHVDQTVDAQKVAPPPLKKNYPKIDYWYYKQYTEESNRRDAEAKMAKLSNERNEDNRKDDRGHSSDGENVMFWHLQDETGRVLDWIEVDAIRGASRHFWRLLYEDYAGKLPSPWRKVDAKAQTRFYEEIEALYPLLKLCEGHWKARSICTNGYSQWHKNHTKTEPSFKCNSEEPTLSDSDSQAVCPAKRSSVAPPPATSNKKARSKSSQYTIYLILNRSRSYKGAR
jgi:hypothetical protein